MNCPVCRAENTERTCRRCRADLGMLFDLEATRDHLLSQVEEAWRSHNRFAARRFALDAARLRNGSDTDRWLAVTSLATRDFKRASAAWKRVDASR